MLNFARLESLLKEMGWSNTYFADQFGKSKVWISDMKRGRGLPDENTLSAIADKLNTTVDYLTDKTNIKNKPATDNGNGLSESEAQLLKLFSSVPDESKALVVGMIEAALKSHGLLK